MKITRILLAVVFAGSTIAPDKRAPTLEPSTARNTASIFRTIGITVWSSIATASTTPVVFKDEKLPPPLAVFTEQGYALAESAYEATGWAIHEAVLDTEALRRYFDTKYGKPKETYVTGHSMGGFLTMMLMERFPTAYDGGLALCGPLAPAPYLMQGVFDIRVVFDYYFPGVLPPPDRVPSDYQDTPALVQKVQALLDAAPEKAGILHRLTTTANNKDLASDMVFSTYILKDFQERGGGNPFDNRNAIYEAPGGDQNALNDGVKRYTADPRAAEYVRTWYTPTGKLFHPMLAIHTTYDPLVPPHIPAMYTLLTEATGSGSLFVQQYVKHDGHCAILPDEIARGFEELRAWATNGTKPSAGLNQ